MNDDHGTSATRPSRVIRTAADVRGQLEVEIVRLTAQPDLDPLKRARAVADLARVVLLAIKLSTIDDRMAALEETLKWRRDSSKEGRHS
jgi:hypothetical protein